MTQQRHFQYPLAAIPLVTLVVAMMFSRGISFWGLLLVVELFTAFMCVEVLTQGIPEKLQDASRDNCHRMDGTLSSRRAARERKAFLKFRSDLWAIFLIVGLAGTSGLFMVDAIVFPISLMGDVASALKDSPDDFKSALRERNVDDKYFKWARQTTRSTNREVKQNERMLWATWPAIVVLMLAGCVAGVLLIQAAYRRALQDFYRGVATRANEYLKIDMGRLEM